ncbi:putative membrane protein (partial), partial [Candidatus Ichthyocystis hellenicum]
MGAQCLYNAKANIAAARSKNDTNTAINVVLSLSSGVISVGVIVAAVIFAAAVVTAAIVAVAVVTAAVVVSTVVAASVITDSVVAATVEVIVGGNKSSIYDFISGQHTSDTVEFLLYDSSQKLLM